MEPQITQMNADIFRRKLHVRLSAQTAVLPQGFIGGTAPDDSFPAKLCKFEVQKQRQLQLGDRKITDHLRDVVISECFNDLRINDHFFINEDIRDQRAD
jgi:hypothetical protein